jgi:outer membrane PBP1 activator LpoA protein
MSKNLLLKFFSIYCIVACIGGCAPTATESGGRVPEIYISTAEDVNAVAEAEALLSLSQEKVATSEELLDIAILFAKSGDLERSLTTVSLVVSEELSNARFVDYSMLNIELALQGQKAEAASGYLHDPRFTQLQQNFDRLYRQRILSIRSDISELLGNSFDSIRYSIQLVSMLNSSSDIINVHDKIWGQLAEQPYQELISCSKNEKPSLSGWCKLSVSVRDYQKNPQVMPSILANWRTNHPNHPAEKNPPSWFQTDANNIRQVSKIAVLLPLQDQYEAPSKTFLDGFMQAYFHLLVQDNMAPPRIRIHDTSVTPIDQAYQNAVIEGAELVIGGIRQSEAATLREMTLTLPTIVLNQSFAEISTQKDNLFQFGNSKHHEMLQIANHALSQGHRSALLISPDKNWGQESVEAFSQYWRAREGRVAETVYYSETIQDFTEELKPALQVDLSENRGLNIRRFINSQVLLSSRRRQDIDFVIILGYPVKARQIKPSLDFLYASDLPVYSISNIYQGKKQADLDRDLSDITFTAMPWTLPGYLNNAMDSDEDMHTAYRQLYALGYDTFLVHRHLPDNEFTLQVPLFGATGLLFIDKETIQRKAKWAKFKNGVAKPLNIK